MLRYKAATKSKKKKYFYLLGAVALLFLTFEIAKETKDSPGKVFTKNKEITMHYLPVTEYFSTEESVTESELKEGLKNNKVLIEKGERESLKEIFGDVVNAAQEVESKDLNSETLKGKIALVRWSSVTNQIKSLKYENKYLWDKEDSGQYSLKVKAKGTGEEFNPAKITKIDALGDVMLSRHVNTKIQANGSDYPWKYVKTRISNADITFANLEVPLSDLRPAPSSGMSFIAPEKNIPGLLSAGIDVVSVANNHSPNFGWKVFEDNLSNLNNAGLNPCGGGLTDKEAREPKVIEKNGIRFGFLCYNSILGGLRAKEETSGMATIEIEPWYRDSQKDIEKVKEDIKSAKQTADVVIVSPHWGVEYKLNPNASQKKVARAMVEAGADLILGTHPHVVQGLEMINGKYVTYSLGNFIFDQEWSAETKEGVALEKYFYGKKPVASNLVPLKIENYSQPKFLGTAGQYIIDRIKSASIGF